MTLFTSIETELTTAATDGLLGVLCIGLGAWLLTLPVQDTWKRNLWLAVLACMAIGALLGAIAHGFDLDEATRAAIWKPLYLSLGLAVALVVVAAVYDWWGPATARWLLPWAVGAGVVFFAITQWLNGAFAVFIAYEAIATAIALGVYTRLAATGRMVGASELALGIALSIVAAVVQVSGLSVRIGVRFDHNGLFHLLQMAAVGLMIPGVARSLRAS